MPRLALISNESPVYCLHLAQKLLSNIVQSFFFYYEKESFSLKLWKVFVLSSAKNGIKFIKRKFHISSENFPKSWSFHWKISFYRFFSYCFIFRRSFDQRRVKIWKLLLRFLMNRIISVFPLVKCLPYFRFVYVCEILEQNRTRNKNPPIFRYSTGKVFNNSIENTWIKDSSSQLVDGKTRSTT